METQIINTYMKLKDLINPTQFDKGAIEMSFIPNMYKRKSVGRKKKVRKEKITMRNSKTGRVYGRRTIYQKAT